jgi:mannose-6-phosphate isomerase-like protein (cupin superfamily)
MKGTVWYRLALVISVCLIPLCARAEPTLTIKPLAERIVSELPAGELYWRIENVDSLDQAKASAGAWSLAAESAGKIWLFTLGPLGGATSGARMVAEVGPIPRVTAKEFLLRINDASGPPGSTTKVHSHPGSEAFFVLEGEQSIRGKDGMLRVKAGQAEAGHGADKAMQVSSSGSVDLHALVMFVVDATRPFSTPAALP